MKNAAVNLKYTAAWETIILSHENVNIKAIFPAKMKTNVNLGIVSWAENFQMIFQHRSAQKLPCIDSVLPFSFLLILPLLKFDCANVDYAEFTSRRKQINHRTTVFGN